MKRPPSHTKTDTHTHALFALCSSDLERSCSSVWWSIWAKSQQLSLVWGAGRAAAAAEIYDSDTQGCRGMCLSLDLIGPSLFPSVSLSPIMSRGFSSSLSHSLRVEVFLGLSLFVSLNPRVSHFSLSSLTFFFFSRLALALTSVGQ